MAYRDSVVINVSYYYVFSLNCFSRVTLTLTSFGQGFDPLPGSSLAEIIAGFTHACLRFRSLIASGELPVDKVGGTPMCMEPNKWYSFLSDPVFAID
jgi:hypothetical protein